MSNRTKLHPYLPKRARLKIGQVLVLFKDAKPHRTGEIVAAVQASVDRAISYEHVAGCIHRLWHVYGAVFQRKHGEYEITDWGLKYLRWKGKKTGAGGGVSSRRAE